jgi:hypothetical protein
MGTWFCFAHASRLPLGSSCVHHLAPNRKIDLLCVFPGSAPRYDLLFLSFNHAVRRSNRLRRLLCDYNLPTQIRFSALQLFDARFPEQSYRIELPLHHILGSLRRSSLPVFVVFIVFTSHPIGF